MDDNLTPAVIYARFSSHKQDEESIEQQVAECTAYARAHGYKVIDIYADSAISGRSDRRPQFQRLKRTSGPCQPKRHDSLQIRVWAHGWPQL